MAKKRSIKVISQSGHNYKATPTIMLKGQWLKELGFDIGDYVSITCENGKLVITLNQDQRYQFRREVRNLVKWYNYISQITRMFDKDLHQEYVFCSYLAKLLPGDPKIEFNLDNRVKLEYYQLAKTFEGAIELEDQAGSWAPTNPKKAGAKKEKMSPLEEIIQRINEEFMGEFTDADRVIVETLYNKMKKDANVQKAAQTDDRVVYDRSVFPGIFDETAMAAYAENTEAYRQLFLDAKKYHAVQAALADNHFMFWRIGMQTFYGPAFICDLGEIANEMLPYTKSAFERYFEDYTTWEIKPSNVWYEERTDFSRKAIGTDRVSHKEVRGYELLQGCDIFEGELLGGCLESIYDMLTATRYEDEREVCERYNLFPSQEEWQGKIMFLETSEEKPTPILVREMLMVIEKTGAFDVINGIIIGKPQDEMYYNEYTI